MKTYINRLKLDKELIHIHPGEIYTTKSTNEVISTLLGSCVAVCLRDEKAGISGMNHFLLPENRNNGFETNAAGRYGISAMEKLINKMLNLGAKKDRLRAKIFGGGNVVSFFKDNIGKKNIDFVRWFLSNEKIPVIGDDVGKKIARKIYFFTRDGAVLVQDISSKTHEVEKEEKNYFQRARKHLQDSDITIF
ncbi:MAG: chemotaxis protein CheD [Spirochaetota bacterium]